MSFSAVFGHEKEIGILKSAIERDRIAHAYLFFGMEGIGKRAIALAFAKTLLCSAVVHADSCDRCPSCLKFDHGNHPDMAIIEADGAFIKVQAVREMMSAMAFRPLEGGKRIFLIDDADKMNPASANALLKTLEEPSPANILLLVTSRAHRLPLTILSRCQQFRFNPLRREDIRRFLEQRFSLECGAAETLASSAGGSIGRALQLNRDDYLKIRDDLMDYLAQNRETNPLETLFLIDFIGRDKKTLADKLDVLRTCFRDVLVYRELGKREVLINPDRVDVIQGLVERSTAQGMVKNLRILDRLTRALEQNANKTLTLEAAMFRLAL